MKYLIVGLGNPGKKFEKTRHNLGFSVADELARQLDISFDLKDNYEIGRGGIDSIPLFILKPLTFMNNSGVAVKRFLRYASGIIPENMFLIYDDLDLPVGKLRLKFNGSGGGHKGIGSIIAECGCKTFYHLKIGIDKPPIKELVDGHVLGTFSPAERKIMKEIIPLAAECIKTAVLHGPVNAMNKFNG